jgi:aerobic carbon-monoxide dehydrogenase medium subunit
MKAASFGYMRVVDLPEALDALVRGEGTAKAMSGGQSLGPMLNLRLARPPQVIDIAGVPELRNVRVDQDGIEIGAGVTHAEIEDGVHEALVGHPMQQVAAGIAYRAVRNRGTIGGSLAHADPAADWVVTLPALDARITLRSRRGERSVQAAAFMVGAYTTVLDADEIITSVRVPRHGPATRWGYHKLCRKPGEFAEASAAVHVDAARRVARIVLGAVDGPPLPLDALAAAVAQGGAAAASREQLRAAIAAALPGRDAIDLKMFTACVARALEQAGLVARTNATGART